MIHLKMFNLFLQLLVCWQIRNYYQSPWGFPRWRRSWGLMGVAMGLLLLRRVYALWDEQAWLDVGLSTCVGLGMYASLRAVLGILTALPPLLPDPPVAHISTDTLSQIIGWDDGAERLFGWTTTEALGRTLFETIIPPQDWEAHRTAVARYLAQPSVSRTFRPIYTFVARRKDGSALPVSVLLIESGLQDGAPQLSAIIRALVPL